MPSLNNLIRCGVALAFSLAMLMPATQAATINVITHTDANLGCTLRQAIVSLNLASLQPGCLIGTGVFGANDTININLKSGNKTITLVSESGGQLVIAQGKDVTINGAGVTIDGGEENRIFYLQDSVLSLDGLTISGGSANRGGGGGIYASSSAVNLINARVSGNSADFDGGGIAATSSNVSLINSVVSDNTADSDGGGISAVSSSVSLSNSVVFGNSVVFFGGGIYAISDSFISLSNSTLSNNSAGFDGGGIDARTTSVSFINSTVSNNDVGFFGGGIHAAVSNIRLVNTLVSGNHGGRGEEILNRDSTSTIVSDGANLFGDSSRTDSKAFDNFTPGTNDITATSDGTRPTTLSSILSPLADNGGPTRTHALPVGSPALAAAKGSNCPAADQRGVPRESRDNSAFYVIKAANQKVVAFELGEDECDIGSFERTPE